VERFQEGARVPGTALRRSAGYLLSRPVFDRHAAGAQLRLFSNVYITELMIYCQASRKIVFFDESVQG
jgi:hypothetical protein